MQGESHKDKVTRYFRWFIVFTGISRLVRMMSSPVSCRFHCQPYQTEFLGKVLLKKDGSLEAETRQLDTFQ